VWSVFIIVPTPLLNDDPRLQPMPEPFQIATLVAKLPVEAFVGLVLPRLARVNIRCLDIFLR